jgi:mannose-1-phosphate guanylyltransferase
MRYGVIMAGGSGKRLWPLSRAGQPKQLLPVVKGKSLLRLAYDRLRYMLPPERIYICTGETHREAILADLPELPAENLLGEPEGRDTSNAIGFSAAVLAKNDPEAAFAVVTADHVITPVDAFTAALDAGFGVTERTGHALVTFGIVPTHAHTGLGYVQRGEAVDGFTDEGKKAFHVEAFKEKPDKPTADRYVESGRFYWNSGMFVWKASAILERLKRHLPDSHSGLQTIADAWGTDRQDNVLNTEYPKLPKISIDYAVMEPAAREAGTVYVVEMPVSWLDVGSWPALAETLDRDEHDNAIDASNSVLIDADANIIVNRDDNHLIAAVGVSDMVIVHAKDITMVCPKSDAERVKELVELAGEKYGETFK